MTHQNNAADHDRQDPNMKSPLVKALFDHSIHPMILLDAQGFILDFNHEFRRAFYYFNGDLIGQTDQTLLRNSIHQLIANKTKNQTGSFPLIIESILYDGLLLPRSVNYIITILEDPKRVLVEIIDNTEALRNKRAAMATKASLDALQNTVSEKELMQELTRIMVDIGHYRFAWIGLLQDDEKKTLLPTAFSGYEAGYLSSVNINLTDPERYRGPIGQAMIKNLPSVCRNAETDPNFAPWRENALKRGYHSVLGIPLSSLNNPPIGALNLYSSEFNAFDQHEVELLVQMASSLTFGILLRRNEQSLNDTTTELQHNLKKMRRIIAQTVEALATSVELRDPYTAGHQRRVTELSVAIAEELGFKGEVLHEVTVASSLHDIGQITIPTEIMTRPGKLSAIEMGIIQTHAKAGYDIVKDVEFPWPIAEIVYQHHEKMDGTGYPRGLKGDEILFTARILMVANVMESMMSHRPYRPSLGQEAALSELKKYRGTWYDASVVDACLRLFEEGRFSFHSGN